MATYSIDGRRYRAMVLQGAANINSHKEEINNLNVFPIPDGDTGDNMHMTIAAGCSRAKSDVLTEAADEMAKGMLLGARGNSGVILSRIFAGIADGICSCAENELPVDGFVKALQCGVRESYGAVSNPVEGTILTVFKDAARVASDCGADSYEDLFDAILNEMEKSLSRTPDLLAVLKEAGVVDSGGAGILCIMRGMADGLRGEAGDLQLQDDVSVGNPSKAAVDLDAFGPDSILEFGYCTEFILRLQSSKVDLDNFDEGVIRDYLNEAGDSVVFFREGSAVKVHVHTKKPGDILNRCQTWGEFLTIKVENMTLQHHEAHIRNDFKFTSRKKYAVVTVAGGEGLRKMFEEAGAGAVIEGGQTMNPSAGSFIEAFDKVDAETVFVFPNNSNIILTARQAAQMYDKSEIIVLPSKDVGQGYVAIASLDFSSSDKSGMVEAATQAMESVKTGMVSKAVRDTSKDGLDIRKGEYIGFSGSRIHCKGTSAEEVTSELCKALDAASSDVALVLKGAGIPDECSGKLVDDLRKNYPVTEFIPYDAGQGVYDYIIVLC